MHDYDAGVDQLLKLYPHSRAAAFGEIGACHRWVARQFEFESAVKVHDFCLAAGIPVYGPTAAGARLVHAPTH